MPVTLPSGLVIYNATPHPLNFALEDGKEVLTAPSDGVISADPYNQEVKRGKRYVLMTVEYGEMEEGRRMIEEIRQVHPEALIVGSVVAAQAYPGEIVSPRPYRSNRYDKSNRLIQSNRFTVFTKKESA